MSDQSEREWSWPGWPPEPPVGSTPPPWMRQCPVCGAGVLHQWTMAHSGMGLPFDGITPWWAYQCDRVGNFARCELLLGHAGTHRNEFEEFIQVDVNPGNTAPQP